MITREITTNRPNRQDIDEKRSIQIMIIKKLLLKNQNNLLVLVSHLKPKQLPIIWIQK